MVHYSNIIAVPVHSHHNSTGFRILHIKSSWTNDATSLSPTSRPTIVPYPDPAFALPRADTTKFSSPPPRITPPTDLKTLLHFSTHFQIVIQPLIIPYFSSLKDKTIYFTHTRWADTFYKKETFVSLFLYPYSPSLTRYNSHILPNYNTTRAAQRFHIYTPHYKFDNIPFLRPVFTPGLLSIKYLAEDPSDHPRSPPHPYPIKSSSLLHTVPPRLSIIHVPPSEYEPSFDPNIHLPYVHTRSSPLFKVPHIGLPRGASVINPIS